MIDLQTISGLPILFDEKNNDLEFRGDFGEIKKSERSLEDLRPYLKNPDANNVLNRASNIIYYVWRYVHLAGDNEKVKENNLRYDLTLLPAGTIDSGSIVGVDPDNEREYVKTAGHYHKGHPEIYEVLLGKAYFLVQSESNVYVAEVSRGEKFLIPPSYGHSTINVFNEPLIMANWVSEKAVYDYESYKNNRGAMYYFVSSGELVSIEKNPHYKSAPEIKKIRAKEYQEFGILKNKPLYSLVETLEKLRFLNYPEEFKLEI